MKKYLSLLGAAGLILCSGCSKKQEADVEAPAPVQVAAVTEDTVRRTINADGTLFPVDQWNVMPKITAPVQRFLVNRGDQVKKDQLLAVLENKDLVATVAANKGQVDQAQANLQNTEMASIPESIVKAQTDVESDQEQFEAAKKVLDSRQQLLKEGALSRKLVDDAGVLYAQAKAQLATAKEHLRALQAAGKQAQMAQAQAQVISAQGNLHSAEAQVAYSEVRSPGAGIVSDRPLYAGDIAATGTPLLVVMDVSRVVARLNVPAADATGIKAGQPATVSLADTAQQVQGKVTVVSPATDLNSSTVQVWVQMDNPGRALKVGAAVHVSIVTETIKNAMLVPVAAILPGETGGTAVLVIDSQSTAHRRDVKLGVRQGDKVQVLTGVMPREDVVIVGGLGVDDKAKVRVVEANAPETEEDQPEADSSEKDAKDQKKDEAKPKQK
ncbi:MAG: efflux RND transporter periplasmic adaptor subunit [Candidatus Sulfopaludibacter sp.]|nr:efflux RND transporter periplasmic adaptor subunit [Candidatus Sulfopaludibacter sp.]